MTRICLRVFRVFRGYILSVVTRSVVTALSERVGLEIFLTDGPGIAEPDAGANRAEPLGCALEFGVCSCQDSGRSA